MKVAFEFNEKLDEIDVKLILFEKNCYITNRLREFPLGLS